MWPNTQETEEIFKMKNFVQLRFHIEVLVKKHWMDQGTISRLYIYIYFKLLKVLNALMDFFKEDHINTSV